MRRLLFKRGFELSIKEITRLSLLFDESLLLCSGGATFNPDDGVIV